MKVAIIGGAGYTGGELLRLVLNHPKLELDFVYSSSQAEKYLYEVHKDLYGRTELKFSNHNTIDAEAIFLCTSHGNSAKILNELRFSQSAKIIDLSNDFRLKKNNYQAFEFIYGLPELNKSQIQHAKYIANPGCFATAINLSLLPFRESFTNHMSIHINAITGSTGAGVSLSPTSHFSWRNNNMSYYKPFKHQHLAEIKETISYDEKSVPEMLFLPNRGNFTRGIFATTYFKTHKTIAELQDMYQHFYLSHPFTTLSEFTLDLKQVVNTNNCFLHVHKHDDYVLITAIIDNLIKGASGQALQNLNIMQGWDETLGLHLKPTIF